MPQKALVVDDDPEIREEIAEILDSMGDAYDMADCQSEGRRMFAAGGHSYYLLDLDIPVRTGTRPRIQNGENLLHEILRRQGLFGPPVIVITGHGKDGPELARRVMSEGAVDFVNKPFPSVGDTLDKAIRRALAKQAQR
ncbi:MAG: response regulator, partial [Candidatus Nealsonbacteria bacterium]|nr:response regulator [Candidatus Nealsonbacteria bacterium]